MAAQITVKTIQKLQSKFLVVFGLALSGNYPAPETLDFTAAVLPPGSVLPTQQPPDSIKVHGQAAYEYKAAPGTTLANGTLRIDQTGAALSGPEAEIGAAAYPAAITADVITGEAIFPALQ